MSETNPIEWLARNALERRFRHFAKIVKDAPETKDLFGPCGLMLTDYAGEDESYRLLARLLAHLDERVSEARSLNELDDPWLNRDTDCIEWYPTVSCFGENCIRDCDRGHVVIRFDTRKRTYQVSLLWWEHGIVSSYDDVFATAHSTVIRRQDEVLRLLKKAHAWGAKRWLEEREPLAKEKERMDEEYNRRLRRELETLP